MSLVAVAACGSNTPTAPTFPSVAGVWTGTFTSNNFSTMTVQLEIRQTQDVINGTWSSSAADWNGTIVGTITTAGSISGGMTISAPPEASGGPRCTGQTTFGGAATATILTGASPGFTGTCATLPQSVTIVTKR